MAVLTLDCLSGIGNDDDMLRDMTSKYILIQVAAHFLSFPPPQKAAPPETSNNAWIICLHQKMAHLGGGFEYFLFSSLFGEDFHFD